MRQALTCGATVVSNGTLTRTILFYDKQANAVAPAITDFLLTDSFAANHNLNNRERFITLMDKVVGAVSFSNNQTFKKYKNLNLDTCYNAGNAGTIGDIQTGSLYLLTYMAAGAVTTAEAVTLARVRIRFEDN